MYTINQTSGTVYLYHDRSYWIMDLYWWKRSTGLINIATAHFQTDRVIYTKVKKVKKGEIANNLSNENI